MKAPCCVLAAIVLFLTQCGPGPTAGKQAIAITAPASGAKLLAGDTVAVQWSQSVSSPVLSYNYHLQASSWQQFATVISVNSQEAKVVLPTDWSSDSFQIKIEDPSGSYNAGFSPYFSENSIFLTSPHAGQTVKVGDSVILSWSINAALFSTLLVELSTDSGKTFNPIFSGESFPPATKGLTWIVGAETGWTFAYPSSGCIVKVGDYNATNVYSTSGIFTVSSR